jgi:selenocysteine-specific elongation factor
MTEKHFIIATAGHVDHGKSALVKALTGIDPDRLPEEKARGITIELGFAQLVLDDPNDQRFSVGIVDVPGHEDFVRNMIAGVGSVDLALFAIAADDGWMPQTEEHLQILMYLGVPRAVVALTKADLGNIDTMQREIREQLNNTPFADAPIIPTSVPTGNGIEDLKSALATEFSMMPQPQDIAKTRLFVDRAFSLHGVGTVVTGTLTGGRFWRGQNVVIGLKNVRGRIRSIQSHRRDLESAGPAMRTAMNLAEVEVGSGPRAIQRGDVVTTIDPCAPSATLDVLLEKSARLHPKTPAGRPIKNGSSVYLHHGTSRVAAKIALFEIDALNCGERAPAQLRLESPIFAFIGDRFVLRDPSEQSTIGGGIVLDPDGDRQNFRDERRGTLLTTRATAPRNVDVCVQSELTFRGSAERTTLLRKSNFSSDEIADALVRLQDLGGIVLRHQIAADAAKWRDLIERATAVIDIAHQKHPEERGPELAELRAALGDCPANAFDALVADLCTGDFVREKSRIGRKSHRAQLPAQIQPAAEKIRATLAAKPFDPPARNAFTQDRDLQQALRFLIEQGELIEIGPDVVLLREAVEKMKAKISAFISRNGPATVSELRQELGTSRRILVPFLENLDRGGVTKREGDKRTLARCDPSESCD